MQNIRNKLIEPSKTRVDLLEKIWNKVRSDNKEDQLISSIMRVAHNALDASASSLLLIDEKSQDFLFKLAYGPVSNQLKRLHISRKSGIAGWVAQNGKPIIVNDAKKNQNFYRGIDEATGFKTRSIIAVPLVIHEKIAGVIEVLNRTDGTSFTQKDLQVMMEVATTATLAMENVKMNKSLQGSYRSTVRELVSLADAREINASGHSRRVAEYAALAADELSLPKLEKQAIEYAAILHDIGKLSIPDNILNKSEKLSSADWELIRQHPLVGYNLLKEIPFLKEACKLILYHHEKYDGKGYPQGLKGEKIPLGARIIAVADAYDNMTIAHPYRAALNKRDAFAELKKCVQTQFCALAVKAFTSGFVKNRLSDRGVRRDYD